MNGDYHGCTCMQYHPREALALWRARALPVVARWLRHGHTLDVPRMMATTRLVTLLETGHRECFAPETTTHSHHLPGCPAARRSVGQLCRLRREPVVHVSDGTAARRWLHTVTEQLARGSA